VDHAAHPAVQAALETPDDISLAFTPRPLLAVGFQAPCRSSRRKPVEIALDRAFMVVESIILRN
jgi:hypothetical protein